MKFYMHTLDGKPAEFIDGNLYYAGHKIQRFAKDLKQIKKEQAQDLNGRLSLDMPDRFERGWHIMEIIGA